MHQLTKLDGELADINDTKIKDFTVLSTKRLKRTRQKIKTDKKIVRNNSCKKCTKLLQVWNIESNWN